MKKLIAILVIIPNLAFAGINNCYAIQDWDLRLYCVAYFKNDQTYCSNIKDQDNRYYCKARVSGEASWCGYIGNMDLKNLCMAMVWK